MGIQGVSSSMSLSGFLGRFGKQLGNKVTQSLDVVYDPSNKDSIEKTRDYDERIEKLIRTPFPVQQEIIKGVSLGLYGRNRNNL